MPYAPLPEYPAEAQVKHWTGTGRFLVKADPDAGLVNGVSTIRSTGHSILNKATEKALYCWKFSPGVGGMIVPGTLTTKGVQISSGAGHTLPEERPSDVALPRCRTQFFTRLSFSE